MVTLDSVFPSFFVLLFLLRLPAETLVCFLFPSCMCLRDWGKSGQLHSLFPLLWSHFASPPFFLCFCSVALRKCTYLDHACPCVRTTSQGWPPMDFCYFNSTRISTRFCVFVLMDILYHIFLQKILQAQFGQHCGAHNNARSQF